MDLSSEKFPWLYLLLGFALMSAWAVISVANAHQRSLARVNDSFTEGSMIADRLGGISDDLARLGVDQQAFLSTGDMRFQDGVIERSERLTLQIGMLNSLVAKSNLQRPILAGLSRSIDQVLASVGESDEIAAVRGRAAAIAYFESREDAISEAGWQADHLRTRITGSISDRIQNARTTKAFLQDLLYVTSAGTGLEHGTRTALFGRLSVDAAAP